MGKTPDASEASRVSSPAATGGAGIFFEQHVGAYWLAQLLVQGIPPILHNCNVAEVCFQTERLGWRTDDFLIVGHDGSGGQRKLVGQVKRSFTVSAKDEDCRKVVLDLWGDYRDSDIFAPATDRFAIVTLRGTNTYLEHFAGLLDCARAAHGSADFEARLSTPGLLNATALGYCDQIQTIIGDAERRCVSRAEVWPFLRVLYALSLDLDTATAQTLAAIKTILAHTAADPDPLGAAESTWASLLQVAGEAMPTARCLRRDDLPEQLRQRHSPVGGSAQRTLRALSDHSAPILAGISANIGEDLHLGRALLVQQVIKQLESSQVVLISGPAGSGKSGIAKDVVGTLAAGHFIFSFRAEEFAYPHIDVVMQNSQIPANTVNLKAILSCQDRKVLLVESMERLLEKSTREAFADLMGLVASDKSWRLVLTCRDYSADLVRDCFLRAVNVEHSVVTVPPLSDEELEEATVAYPALARPLGNEGLRRLLRNPYILDKALQIPWSQELTLPQSEREFRLLFWKEIIRVDHASADAMPRRRENAFVQIALRRAQALNPYAPCGDIDPIALAALMHDSLISLSPKSRGLATPTHDVLEDWALLHWIDEQFMTHPNDLRELASVLGTHPAVRRTYRKWATELVERETETAEQLFHAAMTEGGISPQFRDDTIVSILRSPCSSAILATHCTELLSNRMLHLRRVIHLLRVACVTEPPWPDLPSGSVSLFNIPDGPAWGAVLRVIENHLSLLGPEDYSLLLGFLDDWSRGVTWRSPYPEGSDSVAAIAHWLLPNFDNYQSDTQRKKTLGIIAKIPNADQKRFEALLRGKSKSRDRMSDDFRDLILEGLEGLPAARDMPDALVAAARDYLLCTEADLGIERFDHFHLGLEPLFGISQGRRHDYYPPSAYRGPFLQLLRFHPRKGTDFVVSILSHATEWYAHPRVRTERAEPLPEITLSFTDGSSRKQWCNFQLWGMYRGGSGGPYFLQSLLMALERWLLLFAEAHPGSLDEVLLQFLRRSDSSAISAVVASVATAFPNIAGETLLILLGIPQFILLDRQRLAGESMVGAISSLAKLDAKNRIYSDEREEADAFPHRKQDLEMAILKLQLGPLRSRVFEIIDKHNAALPPETGTDGDLLYWRCALHRMDLRQYTVSQGRVETDQGVSGGTPPEEKIGYLRLDPKEPEPTLKAMTENHAAEFQSMNAKAGLLMWGLSVFRKEKATTYDPSRWREKLDEVRRANDRDGLDEGPDFGRGGLGYVAAVCVRDHWEEMSREEQEWSVNRVCDEVEQTADLWSQESRAQKNSMASDRPCAEVLSLLVGQPLNDMQNARVRQGLVTALTHAVQEVRLHAAIGVGRYLWRTGSELALRCVNAIATDAALVQVEAEANSSRQYDERRQLDEIEWEAAKQVRQRFSTLNDTSLVAYQTLDITQWFGAEANERILTICGQLPANRDAIVAFQRLAATLVQWWDADEDRRRDRGREIPNRNHETESALTNLLEHFLLRTEELEAATIIAPILDAMDRHSEKIRWILLGLIEIEDREARTQQFWALWQLFADRARHAVWIEAIDNEHASGSTMISALFLVTWWKEDVRHWRTLEGHAGHVHALFEDLPLSSRIMDAYVSFLYHIGEQSLPETFVRLATRLQLGDAQRMMRNENTVYMMETMLQRHVYGRPLELKSRTDLRGAVLCLLDLLVERGSSAAFRMRDDFVTPVSVA